MPYNIPYNTTIADRQQRRVTAQNAQVAAQNAQVAAQNAQNAQVAADFIAVDNAVNNALDQNQDGQNNAAEINVTNIDRQIPEHIQQLPFYTQQLAIIGANMLASAGQNMMSQLRNNISMIPITINDPRISSYLDTLFNGVGQYARQSATELLNSLGEIENGAITIGRLLELAGVNQVLQAVGDAIVPFRVVEEENTGNNGNNNYMDTSDNEGDYGDYGDYGGSKRRKSRTSRKSRKSRKSKKSRKSNKARKSKRRRTYRRK
jgi:hypothetical protein